LEIQHFNLVVSANPAIWEWIQVQSICFCCSQNMKVLAGKQIATTMTFDAQEPRLVQASDFGLVILVEM
jgi:hypothetical protein